MITLEWDGDDLTWLATAVDAAEQELGSASAGEPLAAMSQLAVVLADALVRHRLADRPHAQAGIDIAGCVDLAKAIAGADLSEEPPPDVISGWHRAAKNATGAYPAGRGIVVPMQPGWHSTEGRVAVRLTRAVARRDGSGYGTGQTVLADIADAADPPQPSDHVVVRFGAEGDRLFAWKAAD